MVNLNRVLLIGNLTRDPELRYTPSGAAACEFSIAVNRNWTDKKTGEKKEEVSFIDIVSWGRTAEICAEYLKKGRSTFVEGRLQQDRWEDQKTGQKRSKIRVNAERVQFLGGRSTDEAPASQEISGKVAPEEDIPF